MRLGSGIFAFVLLLVLSLTPQIAGPLTATSVPPLGSFLAFLTIYHCVWKVYSNKTLSRYDRFGYSICVVVFGSLLAFWLGAVLQLGIVTFAPALIAVSIYVVAALNVGYCLLKITKTLPSSMVVPLLGKKQAAQTKVDGDDTNETVLTLPG